MTAGGFTDGAPEGSFWAKLRKHSVALVFCMVIFPLLVLLAFRADSRPSFDWILRIGAGSKQDSGDPSSDKLFGGLLSTAFENETSCRSRYEIASYWKSSSHLPSPYLVQKLRAYEALHRRCGPNTELYRRSIEQLKSNKLSTGHSECNYVVWIASDGLGNRIISMVSTFLYALLNDKVLLIDPEHLQGLFCEPFPDSSWVLQSIFFPVKDYKYFNAKRPQSYGNMVRNKVVNFDDTSHAKNASVPIFAYLHLKHDFGEFDRKFFCEESQILLQRIPWLLLRSNQYFLPGLFLVSRYVEELDRLFPQKDTVFHHLARYLLHPSDLVWGYITRYYEAYLSNGEERVGIQARPLGNAFERHLEQMVNCTMVAKLLPEIDVRKPISTSAQGAKHKVVLVTSLKIGYFERLRDMFYEHPTIDGQVIRVYQPSHEKVQHTERQSHNVKALSEMYLLSFSDVLVTSGKSTFGYVARGLGGLKPWILVLKHGSVCSRALSMEPCYHHPRKLSCKEHKYDDKGAVVPHVRHCEDVGRGIKLFDQVS